MAGEKRKLSFANIEDVGEEGEEEEGEPRRHGGGGGVAKKRRKVEFQDVTIFHFERRQGFVCVPSQGGNTLGMEDDHFAVEVLTVDEHVAERRGEGTEEDDSASLLLPVDSKERRTVLRNTGVQEIDVWEKEECKQLRLSRQQCGCSCIGSCSPATCSCAGGGIMCQVDRPGFPCGCTLESCSNPSGRLEFNPIKVRTHFVKTIMRTRIEEARCLQNQRGYINRNLGYLAQLYGGGGSSSGGESSTAGTSQWNWSEHGWWTAPDTTEGSTAEEEEGTGSEQEEQVSSPETESEEEMSEEQYSSSERHVAEIIDDILNNITREESVEQNYFTNHLLAVNPFQTNDVTNSYSSMPCAEIYSGQVESQSYPITEPSSSYSISELQTGLQVYAEQCKLYKEANIEAFNYISSSCDHPENQVNGNSSENVADNVIFDFDYSCFSENTDNAFQLQESTVVENEEIPCNELEVETTSSVPQEETLFSVEESDSSQLSSESSEEGEILQKEEGGGGGILPDLHRPSLVTTIPA